MRDPALTAADLERRAMANPFGPEAQALEAERLRNARIEQETWDRAIENAIFPVVGMPATLMVGSDLRSGKITEVLRNGQEVQWRRPGLFRADRLERFTRRRDGSYRLKGAGKSSTQRLIVGAARDHYDRMF